ncbi:MAG: hypothetical protein FRX48_02007 [Lasallia pustulata]|uniref:Uncharacterized protein n=1 Tax=Lasallia pustulata TaxID=136370 RepID=A0A5M8PX50_9LECA|nr:MAG: hypothetical protein FRX48_02007 [Lasallia pustulata]
MPTSTSSTTIAQIFDAASQDKREQPWKKYLVNAAVGVAPSDETEVIKTGGECDVLTNWIEQ